MFGRGGDTGPGLVRPCSWGKDGDTAYSRRRFYHDPMIKWLVPVCGRSSRSDASSVCVTMVTSQNHIHDTSSVPYNHTCLFLEVSFSTTCLPRAPFFLCVSVCFVGRESCSPHLCVEEMFFYSAGPTAVTSPFDFVAFFVPLCIIELLSNRPEYTEYHF